MIGRTVLVLLATGLMVGTAGAQEMSPEGGSATATTATTPAGNKPSLSKKLSESNGVIKPKGNVDPGIRAAVPDPHPNSTPVIPPSATGGNSAK